PRRLPGVVVGLLRGGPSSPRAPCACASACGSGGSPRRVRGRGARTASRNCGGASSRGRSLRAASSSSGRAAPDRRCFHGREPALRSLPSMHRRAPRKRLRGQFGGGVGIIAQNRWKGGGEAPVEPLYFLK